MKICNFDFYNDILFNFLKSKSCIKNMTTDLEFLCNYK